MTDRDCLQYAANWPALSNFLGSHFHQDADIEELDTAIKRAVLREPDATYRLAVLVEAADWLDNHQLRKDEIEDFVEDGFGVVWPFSGHEEAVQFVFLIHSELAGALDRNVK